MSSIPCDIVILPTNDLARKQILLSQKFSSQDSLYTLDGHNYFPHISLYMTQLKIDSLEMVKVLLANIAAQTKALNLTATRYYQALGYLDIEYKRTVTLSQSQEKVLFAINPVRDGMREKDKVRMQTATGLTRENYEKYGYKDIGELFRPHASITRFANENSIDTSNLPTPAQFSGQYLKLGIFEMGDNGTCIREIVSYSLG